MEDDGFRALVERSFPEEPLPHRFFWQDGDKSYDRDVREELSKRMEQQSWKKITILDWQMVGVPPVLSRSCLEPETFVYYLPSLLVSIADDMRYAEETLEAIVPYNYSKIPRGVWWSEFHKSISPIQREALLRFIACVRHVASEKKTYINPELVHAAELIWHGLD